MRIDIIDVEEEKLLQVGVCDIDIYIIYRGGWVNCIRGEGVYIYIYIYRYIYVVGFGGGKYIG